MNILYRITWVYIHLRNRSRKSLKNDFRLKIPWNDDHFGIILIDLKNSTSLADPFTGVEVPKIPGIQLFSIIHT